MKAALNDAAVSPDEVDYINAHGTSTVQNDLTETGPLRKCLEKSQGKFPSVQISPCWAML